MTLDQLKQIVELGCTLGAKFKLDPILRETAEGKDVLKQFAHLLFVEKRFTETIEVLLFLPAVSPEDTFLLMQSIRNFLFRIDDNELEGLPDAQELWQEILNNEDMETRQELVANSPQPLSLDDYPQRVIDYYLEVIKSPIRHVHIMTLRKHPENTTVTFDKFNLTEAELVYLERFIKTHPNRLNKLIIINMKLNNDELCRLIHLLAIPDATLSIEYSSIDGIDIAFHGSFLRNNQKLTTEFFIREYPTTKDKQIFLEFCTQYMMKQFDALEQIAVDESAAVKLLEHIIDAFVLYATNLTRSFEDGSSKSSISEVRRLINSRFYQFTDKHYSFALIERWTGRHYSHEDIALFMKDNLEFLKKLILSRYEQHDFLNTIKLCLLSSGFLATPTPYSYRAGLFFSKEHFIPEMEQMLLESLWGFLLPTKKQPKHLDYESILLRIKPDLRATGNEAKKHVLNYFNQQVKPAEHQSVQEITTATESISPGSRA